MKKTLSIVGLTLLALLLACATGWFYADQLLDGFARPQLENLAGTLLDGQVKIGRLQRTEHGVEALDLQVSTPQISAEIPRLIVNFSIASLWHRQLEMILINQPQAQLKLDGKQESGDVSPQQSTLQLPFSVALIRITDGQLDLSASPRTFHFQQLNFSGSLQPRSPFTLSGSVGEDSPDRQSFNIAGELRFSPARTLTLQRVSWQERQILNAPLTVALAEDGMDLKNSQFVLADFDDRQLQELFNALNQPSPLPKGLGFALNKVGIGVSFTDSGAQLELTVDSGQLTWNQFNSSFSRLRADLLQTSQGWEMSGQFSGPAQSNIRVNARLDNNKQWSGKARLLIADPGGLKEALFGGSPIAFKGGLELATDFSLSGKNLAITTKIQGMPSKEQHNQYLLNLSTMSGQLKLSLRDGKESFSLALSQASQPLLRASGTSQKINVAVQAAQLDAIKQLLPPDRIPNQLQEAAAIDLSGEIAATKTGWTGQIRVAAKHAVIEGLTLAKLSGRSKLQFNSDRIIFSRISASSDVAYGATLTGKINATAAAEISKAGLILQLDQVAVTDINYNAEDGLSGIGAAAVSVVGSVKGDWPLQTIALDLNGTLSVQEVLAGVFYADLSQYKATFSLQGEENINTAELRARSLKINLPQIAQLTAAGHFKTGKIDAQGQVKFIELKESYNKTIKPLLEGTVTQLEALELSGHTTVDYHVLKQSTGWQVSGATIFKGLNAHWNQEKVAIIDGNGSLPFVIGNGSLPDIPSQPRSSGEMSIQALTFGPATIKQARLKITAEPNRMTLPSSLRLQLADGVLAISDLTMGWDEGQPQGELNINVTGVNLEALTRDLGLPVMQGSLSADLGKIRYHNRELSTAGVASIAVFDGHFKISNMRYIQPFTSHPTFSADIDFNAIDLQQATRTFDFGEMNGILDGHIRGLQLYGRTPAAFEASVSTRDSGTRNISVKALNNINILSQGGMSAALSRGIYRFIDFYRYHKIAFDCSLVNDTFTLIGTARPDSKRYLVDGSFLPPRIDITISTPTISFKEMVKRLSRIDRTSGKT